ncbi:regulatory protein RecX [Kushneria phosphatilytica]|uniref:Regulatory protein RecX n=1 Tax=Kushneria phosphatilytica TaxID=657387 RepID=A0A1S1NZB2_9GAMM|nr:regulatory protein RecX [Kushneria phosphatilytica]OHV13856.1 recombinase RecX [Kushneria phosphatilytica]QEL10411.1 regulatory protein RecX [Kushneria phosphatilytica]
MSEMQRDPREDAIVLLARREYSVVELRERLARHEHEPETIEQVLNALQAEGLQSDSRFAEQFLRSRVNRLQGPRRIEAELRQRGIDQALIVTTLSESTVDWFALACQALRRRFDGPGNDRREQAKRLRFLASRGFDGEQGYHALEHAWTSSEEL